MPRNIFLSFAKCVAGASVLELLSAVTEWLLGQYYGYAVFRENTASVEIQFFGDILFAYGSTALALGYGAGIVLLAQGRKWKPVLRPLENLGRMGLTVYLSGTIMFTTAFLWLWFWPAIPDRTSEGHRIRQYSSSQSR